MKKKLETRIEAFKDDVIEARLVDIPEWKIHLLSSSLPKQHAYLGMPKRRKYHGIVILHGMCELNPIPEGQESHSAKLCDFVSEDEIEKFGSSNLVDLESNAFKLHELVHNFYMLRELAIKHGFKTSLGNLYFFPVKRSNLISVFSMNVGISN